jgi:hypothetical protein
VKPPTTPAKLQRASACGQSVPAAPRSRTAPMIQIIGAGPSRLPGSKRYAGSEPGLTRMRRHFFFLQTLSRMRWQLIS